MLRISTTTIDSYRSYIEEDKLFGNIVTTEEKLLSYIKREAPPSPKMELGTAFHEILETPQICLDRFAKKINDKDLAFMSSNGNIFPFDIITKCYDTIDYSFPFEVKKTKIYEIEGEQIEVVAKADQWQGNIINEHKTSWGEIYINREGERTSGESFNWEKYHKSCQWKFYLDIFEAERVRYKVFELAIDKTDYDKITLLGIHPFEMFPYENIKYDRLNLLESFVNYIHFRKLEDYFKPKES